MLFSGDLSSFCYFFCKLIVQGCSTRVWDENKKSENVYDMRPLTSVIYYKTAD